MTQIIPRFAIVFDALKDGKRIDLKFQHTAPADVAIPLPGDEVLLPKDVATKAGFTGKVFTVVSRRFLYDGLAGIAGAVVLTLSHSDESATKL